MSRHLEATLIFNPFGGMLSLQKDIRGIVDFWQNKGWEISIEQTKYPGHAENLARQAVLKEHVLVLAVGGDGILGEVANGLVNSNTILAPLPGGTGNSFTKELMMPLRKPYSRDLGQACQVLFDGLVHKIDVGLNGDGKIFLQWSGAGVDGRLVHRIEPRSQRIRKLGSLGYVSKGLLSLPSFRGTESTIYIDGQKVTGRFLMVTVANCRRYAGGMAMLNPTGVLDDGLLELWSFEGDHMLDVLIFLWHLRAGRHIDHPRVNCFRGCDISLDTEIPLPVHRDGDPVDFTPLRCTVLPQALQILIPTTVPDGLLSQPGIPLPNALTAF